MRKRSVLTRLHHYFFPHKHNGYKPHIFRLTSVVSIALALVILESAYLTQINFIFPRTNFLGAVLPGTLLALTNDDRAANNVPAVSENALLTQAAQDVANDMATQGYFAHISPDGKDPWYWLNLVGYKYQDAGENLAVNFTDSSAVESAWMASPTHHANIVKPQYTQMGIGVANGMYQGKEATFIVSFFGSPETAASLLQSQQQKAVVASENAAAVAPSASISPKTSTTAPVAEVLGTQTQVVAVSANPLSFAGFLALAATSPTLTMTYILSALAIAVLILLIVAIVVKVRVQYVEVIAGGLFLLLVLLGLLLFNAQSAAKVQVSDGSHSATASLST